MRIFQMQVLSGLAMPGRRERCLPTVATEYVSKPVNLMQIGNLIGSLLDGK